MLSQLAPRWLFGWRFSRMKSRCLHSEQSALPFFLVVEWKLFFFFFFLFLMCIFFFSLDAAWPGQDRSCISALQPRLRSMSCHLILFAAVNAVPLISTLLYWNTKPSLTTLPHPSPSPSLFPLSHFLLKGKKHKIRFFLGTCVSVEKREKRKRESWEL